MNEAIDRVPAASSVESVLVDIGASGSPPEAWEPIVRHAIYVGLDTDRRELPDVPQDQNDRSIIVNEAVTIAPDLAEARSYPTRSPYCLRTLTPDTEVLGDYFFSDLFTEREVSVRATSLSAVLDRLDCRARTGSRPTRKARTWGCSRASRTISRGVLAVLSRGERLGAHEAHDSPGWCEARYLRTLASLEVRNAETRDYVLLWAFAMIEQQWGYALDVACAHEEQFPQDSVSSVLHDLPLRRVMQQDWKVRSVVGQLLLPRVKRFLKQRVQS